MPLTVRDLVSTPDLGLRLLTQAPDVDRPVTWVHVSELRDPTPFLSGGEMLLTTGIAFESAPDGGGADPDEYVQRLTGAAVVGLGFGTGLSHSDVPEDLVAAARRHGLPIIEVPRSTPFIAISRAVSRAVAADEYASVTRTFTAQQALTKAALAPAGPDRLVRLLAQQLTGWVVLLDRSGAPIAAYPETARTTVDALATEMAVLAAHRGPVSSGFPLGGDTVSLQSVGAGTRGRAFLAVGRPGQLTAADRHLVNAAVMLLTIRLEQSSTSDVGLGQLRSALVRLVLSGQHELARPIAEHLGSPLPAEPLAVLMAIGDISGVAAQLDDAGPSSVGRMLVGEIDGSLVVLVYGGPDVAADCAARIGMAGLAATAGLGDGVPPGMPGVARVPGPSGMPGVARVPGPSGMPGVARVPGPSGMPGLPGVSTATGVLGLSGMPGVPGGLCVGISAPTGYADLQAAHRQAAQAAAFGRRTLRAVTAFNDIAMWGITGLLGADQGRAFAESLLLPLIQHDLAGRGDLINSLRAWLSHHGQWDPSATALGVHRHTLRHRMNTVEQLLGRSLDSPGTRSELWLALEIIEPSRSP